MNERKFYNVVIYIRVSTREQAESGYSIGEQEERLRAYCAAMGWTISRVCSDPGFSGAKLDRPGLRDLLDEVHAGRCDAVLVWKLDRLSRSQKDTLFLIEDELLKNNVAFVSMNENFDTSTPFGRAMIGILSVFAQLEREQIRERMAMGADARAKAGKWHGGGFDPIGYDYKDGRLVFNEYEAAQIREVYDLYLTKGWAVHRIAVYMQENYTTKYGSWGSDAAVRSVLQTPLYTGKITWHGHTYDGEHEPIISQELYDAAQTRLAELSWKPSPGSVQKTPFQQTTILGGLIFCGNCGARYYAKGCYSGHKPNLVYRPYYTCYSRGKTCKRMIKDPTCRNPSFAVVNLDPIILGEILKLSFDADAFDSIASGAGSKSASEAQRSRAAIEGRIAELHKQVERLIDLCRIGGGMPIQTIALEIEKAQAEMDKLEKSLARIDAESQPAETDTLDVARQLLSTAEQVIEHGSLEAKRELVHGLIDKITIYENDIKIHWAFSPAE